MTQKTSIKWIKFCANLNSVSERSAGVRGSNPGRDLTKIFSLIFDRETYVIAVLEVTLLLFLLVFVMWTLMSKCLDMLLKVWEKICRGFEQKRFESVLRKFWGLFEQKKSRPDRDSNYRPPALFLETKKLLKKHCSIFDN